MAKENERVVQEYKYILEKSEEFIKYFEGDEKEKIRLYYKGMQSAYIKYCTEILHGKLYSPQPTLGNVIATGGESYKEYKENREAVNQSRAAISMKNANVEDYYQVIVQMLEKKNLYTRPLSPKERQEKRVKMFKEDSKQFNVREKMYIYFYDISNIVEYVIFALPILVFGFWIIGYGQLALVSILLGVGFFIFLTLIGKEPKV